MLELFIEGEWYAATSNANYQRHTMPSGGYVWRKLRATEQNRHVREQLHAAYMEGVRSTANVRKLEQPPT